MANIFFRGGDDFRPQYREAVNIRGTCTDATVLIVTATATKEVVDDVVSCMRISKNPTMYTELPNRPNIYLDIVKKEQPETYDPEQDFLWLAEELLDLGKNCPKTVIFTDNKNDAYEIASSLKQELQNQHKDYYYDDDGFSMKEKHNFRIVSMYNGLASEPLQEYTLRTFKPANSKLRVLISTCAFAMGVQIEELIRVIHYGKIRSAMNYVQEMGRCARSGEQGRMTWYCRGGSLEDADLFNEIKKMNKCIRNLLMTRFKLPSTNDDMLDEKHLPRINCCPVCDASL